MPRNKVLEKAKVSMPSGRNAFDLSYEKSYSQYAADLNVCYCQACVAGTKGHISRKVFTRTADVVSPAFHRVTEHFDFFVVPLHAIWRAWENWKTNINDMQDTNLVKWDSDVMGPDLNLSSYAPRMNFTNLASTCGLKDTVSATSARKINDMLRLVEQLRYGAMYDVLHTGDSTMLNLFKIAAYQKVYFDHYRNTAYESNNPYAYNFDWLYNASGDVGELKVGLGSPGSRTKSDAVARELFTMRRVNYRNDYFHNIYPSLNYVVSQPNGGNWKLPSNIGQLLVRGSSTSVDSGTVAAIGKLRGDSAQSSTAGGVSVGGALTGANTVGISVQSIRAAFALDKLLRASAYAPKHVKDQYKALYGVDGVEDFDMRSERIGSFQSDVQFVEVTNMAQSSQANLGDLGAKGVGSKDNDGSLSYYCKYDSIIIGLHYFLPRARYDSLGVDPWNIKLSREDFYVKAFENLGLRPFYLHYIDMDGNRSTVVGWTVPNFEYKILPDLNEGAFKNQVQQIEFREGDPDDSLVVSRVYGALRSFVPHNDTVFDENTIGTAEYFKAAAEDLNSLFAQAVTSYHPINEFQFFGDFRISNAVVAPMSVHGQPMI